MEFATNIQSKALCALTICLVAPFTSGPLFWLQCSLNYEVAPDFELPDACIAKSARHETKSSYGHGLGSQAPKESDQLKAETPELAQPDAPSQPVEGKKNKINDDLEKHAKKVADQSEKSASDDESYKRGIEYRMLTQTVAHLKSGSLVAGTQCLRQLTQKYPDNDDYQRLLDLAEGRLKSEMWYRFQRRELASRKKESMWIENDDARLTRLKHSTWLLLSKSPKKSEQQNTRNQTPQER